MSLKLRRGLESQRTTITPEQGEIIYTTDTKILYVGDGTTPGGTSVSAPVTSVNNFVGSVQLNADNIPESGSPTNKYFTSERAQDAIWDALNHANHINVSFTYDDVNNRIVASTPLYNDEQAQDAVWTALQNGTHTRVSWSYDDLNNALSLTSTHETYRNILASPNLTVVDVISGANYTRSPQVVVSRGVGDTTGNGAQIVAVLAPSTVETIQIVNPGTGYTIPPTITFVGGGPDDGVVQARATCTVSGGQIQSVTITFAGVGYTGHPTIQLSGGNGNGAVLRAFLAPTLITRYEVKAVGSGYTTTPVLTVSPNEFDTTGYGGGGTLIWSDRLQASTATDTLEFFSPSADVILSTAQGGANAKRVVIDIRNLGEVIPGTEGNLAYYGKTGNKLLPTRGVAWVDYAGIFQVGAEAQGIDGNLRVLRNSYSSAAGSGITMEQYHATQDTVNFNFIRGRGTQSSPLAVLASDKLADISFGGYDGTTTLFGAQITARVDGSYTSGTNRLPVRLEFYTRGATDGIAGLALTLNGDKTAVFPSTVTTTGVNTSTVTSTGTISLNANTRTQVNAPFKLASYSTAGRNALSAQVGDIIYNTDANKFQGYQNTSGTTLEWVDLS